MIQRRPHTDESGGLCSCCKGQSEDPFTVTLPAMSTQHAYPFADAETLPPKPMDSPLATDIRATG